MDSQILLTSLVRLPDRICPPTDRPWHCNINTTTVCRTVCTAAGPHQRCVDADILASAFSGIQIYVCIRRGCGLGLDVSVSRRTNVSSREKLSTSRSCLSLGHLRLVPKTNFRPNCAGHINKTSRFEWSVKGL